MIDLSYLNDYEGQTVNAVELLDPRYNKGQESNIYTGVLVPSDSRLMVNIYKGTFMEGAFYGELAEWIPYLGKTETIWDIALIKDGSKLLSHKLWNKELGQYIVIGLNDEEIGFIDCIKTPYGTPYGDLMKMGRQLWYDLNANVWLRLPDKKTELDKLLEGFKENAKELYKIWRLQNTDCERKFNTQTGRFEAGK